jgi:DNA-binding LacI/PurR family transcriptional regulator
MKGIAQLASELGVSTATVSRALNGKSDVNETTRNRVLEAAARLGYAANASARSLARGATNSVGFMIELNPETATTDNFFMGVFDGVQSVFSQHDLELVVLPCPTSGDPYHYLQRFVARNAVDAMIISATQRVDPRIDLLQARSIPFVTLGRSTSGKDYSWIDLDFEGVVATALERLAARGHSRIAVTVPASHINFAYLIRDTYRRAMKRLGLPFDSSLAVETIWTEQGGYDLADRLFELGDPPTAVLLMYEMISIGFFRRLQELKKRPGRDIGIIAFRDEPAIRFMSPSVTRFSLSLHDLGVGIAEAVLAQLPAFRERYPMGPVQRRWALELMPGESDGAVVAPKPPKRVRAAAPRKT